jgi:hypothetical protein
MIGGNTELLEQLLGFSAVWNLSYRQLIGSNAFLSESPENDVTQNRPGFLL